MEGLDPEASAAEAKARGNDLFKTKTKVALAEALEAYTEAVNHTPSNHILYANRSACYLELAGIHWENKEKVTAFASALREAKKCTELGPDWAKGHIRQATAEYELIAASLAWEKRKIEDEKFKFKPKAGGPFVGEGAKVGSGLEEVEEIYTGTPAEVEEGAVPVGEEAGEEEEEEWEVVEVPMEPELAELAASACYAGVEASCRAGLALDATKDELRTRLQDLRDKGHGTDEAADKALQNAEAANTIKAEGNAAFSAKRFADGIKAYTRALAEDPFNHALWSNRSACYAEEEEFENALRDGDRCVALNPAFAKGHSRRSLALYQLGRYPEAQAAAEAGLAISADNAALLKMLATAKVETAETAATQKMMHQFRSEARQDAKMQKIIQSLNMNGAGVQMFNGMGGGGAGGLADLLRGAGGGGGSGGMGGKANMSDAQMRQMARAMSTAGAGK